MLRTLSRPRVDRPQRPRATSSRAACMRPRLEALEERTLLDASTLVVGRTLSSYFAGGVQNNQVTITYTAYNEQANPETGVTISTTLAPT